MAITERCNDCDYYVPNGNGITGGRCHRYPNYRHPPFASEQDKPGFYPRVGEDDWCAEHSDLRFPEIDT